MSVAVEVIAIGTELLYGETIDTNAAWLGERLLEIGLPVTRRTTVGDDHARLGGALRESLERADVVICSGGLGPTPDDLTVDVVADVTGRALRTEAHWIDVLRARFEARGVRMPDINERQARVPDGAQLLPNPRGTAPGLWLEVESTILILLPGVPAEFIALTEQDVLPRLRERYPDAQPLRRLRLRTTGIAEARLAEKLAALEPQLAPLDVAYYPSHTGVDIRLTAPAGTAAADASAALRAAGERVRALVGEDVYAEGGSDLAAGVLALLRARQRRLAVAESCTGGMLAQRLTATPGASDVFVGGVVAYANAAKSALLAVAPDLIQRHGAVSEEVALAMADGAIARFAADCALSVTGIAGPGGGSADKPVGTVWIAVRTGEDRRAHRLVLPGDRGEIRARATQAALDLLRRAINRTEEAR